MYKYAISLRPVVAAGGVIGLDDKRKMIFEGVLQFMSKLIQSAQEVESSEITEDFTILVTAKQDITDSLKKLGGNAIITAL